MAVTHQRANSGATGDVRPVELPRHAVPRLTYDRRPDILLLTFFGPERSHVVRYVSDACGLLVDPVDDAVVGVEIDDVLANAVSASPLLLGAIAAAETTDLSAADRALLPTPLPLMAAVRAVLDVVNAAS